MSLAINGKSTTCINWTCSSDEPPNTPEWNLATLKEFSLGVSGVFPL